MARKKVTLAYIHNDAERKASFKKRKKGLIKKVSEINTLCDVEACAVIYSPYDETPVVWPSYEAAQRLIRGYKELPDIEKGLKMVSQVSFTRNENKKAEARLLRLEKENRRKELEIFMHNAIEGRASMKDFDPRDAGEMRFIIHKTLEEITSRMKALEKAGAGGRTSLSRAAGGRGGDGEVPPADSNPSRF